MNREPYRGRSLKNSLTHRGWEIVYTCMPRYRSGPEVVWSKWVARKGDRVLRGREDPPGSPCGAYGAAIKAIDEIEIPRVAPYDPYEAVL